MPYICCRDRSESCYLHNDLAWENNNKHQSLEIEFHPHIHLSTQQAYSKICSKRYRKIPNRIEFKHSRYQHIQHTHQMWKQITAGVGHCARSSHVDLDIVAQQQPAGPAGPARSGGAPPDQGVRARHVRRLVLVWILCTCVVYYFEMCCICF